MSQFNSLFALLVLVAACGFSDCLASTVTYSTQSAYDAATTGNSTVTFAGTVPASTATQLIPPSTTISGVGFSIDTSSSNGVLYEIGAGYGPHYGIATDLSSQASTTGNNLLITLPGYYTSFSLDFNSFVNTSGVFSTDPLAITLSDGYVVTGTPAANGTYEFFGLSSTQSFDTIEITDPSTSGTGVINVEQLEYGGAVAPVAVSPEPSSFSLLGLGVCALACMGVMVRRNRLGAMTA